MTWMPCCAGKELTQLACPLASWTSELCLMRPTCRYQEAYLAQY
jgi:hypothetical protein